MLHLNDELGDIPIARHHVRAATGITDVIYDLIQKEDIKSFNDFGAGIGQYKADLTARVPNLVWNSYDGAGNVEEYTKGFVKIYFWDKNGPFKIV